MSAAHPPSLASAWLAGPRLQGEPWLNAESGLEFLTRCDLLDSFLIFKRALLVVVGQTPTRFDTKKRSAIGPQREIRNPGQIGDDRPSRRRVGIREGAIGNVCQFENVRPWQFFSGKGHFTSGEPNVFRLAAQV